MNEQGNSNPIIVEHYIWMLKARESCKDKKHKIIQASFTGATLIYGYLLLIESDETIITFGYFIPILIFYTARQISIGLHSEILNYNKRIDFIEEGEFDEAYIEFKKTKKSLYIPDRKANWMSFRIYNGLIIFASILLLLRLFKI